MRRDTRQRKQALAGLRAISGEQQLLGTLVRVIGSGKQALDAVMLEMGRMVAESIMTPVVNSGRHELQPHAAGC